MPLIKILPENLANKIAAGEVVERPASVVKELVENAIDAKSRRIFVSLSDGGAGFIQVHDDGDGMTREDTLLAFHRHATSKLATEGDINAITTLGFRGEALPSIASISRIHLSTQTEHALEGTEIVIEGGVLQSVKTTGANKGSLFEISDLFYNTPARKKFLKSIQTELGHISDAVFQLALSYPMIHFRLSHGGRVLLNCPSVPDLTGRILELFGESTVKQCMEVHCETSLTTEDQEGAPQSVRLSVDAFFSRPPLPRPHKRGQYIIVNQRPVKNPLISHAIYDAYGNYLMKGEHPFFVLYLSIDPAWIDVNVHPTKKEIRFRNSDMIYKSVRGIIRNALSSASQTADMTPQKSLHEPSYPLSQSTWIGWPETVKEGRTLYTTPIKTASALEIQAASEILPPSHFPSDVPLIRPLGQVYGTFLLADVDGELVLVDQHTVHERLLFESLLRQQSGQSMEIQPLLIPQQVDLPPREAGILKDSLKELEGVGLKIDIFGERTFLIRETPAMISHANFESLLFDLTDELTQGGGSSLPERPMRNLIASIACHGAIRAHQTLSLNEIETLLKRYFQEKCPPTCPHGRPIIVRFPLPDLLKLFRRT